MFYLNEIMKKITLLLTLLPFLIFANTSITTILNQEIEISDEMSMTVQIKESNGSIYIPEHTHPSPGVVYLLKGQVEVDIEGIKTLYKAGDSWIEPQNKLHSGKSIGRIKYFVVYHHPTGRPYIN